LRHRWGDDDDDDSEEEEADDDDDDGGNHQAAGEDDDYVYGDDGDGRANHNYAKGRLYAPCSISAAANPLWSSPPFPSPQTEALRADLAAAGRARETQEESIRALQNQISRQAAEMIEAQASLETRRLEVEALRKELGDSHSVKEGLEAGLKVMTLRWEEATAALEKAGMSNKALEERLQAAAHVRAVEVVWTPDDLCCIQGAGMRMYGRGQDCHSMWRPLCML
jgi:hypothetical protein